MQKAAVLLLLFLPHIVAACTCATARSVCQEVASSNLVFIGTVEAVKSGLQGKTARFRIQTLIQQKQDDDDSAKKPAKLDFVEISSESGDCGILFQKGESYLVYANDDEQTGRFETSICYRTTRLSDAGEDLGYLYFVQNGGVRSLRLEGFVTSESAQRLPDAFHYAASIKAPVADVVVEVKSGAVTRFAQSDVNGRFIFDGLAEGDYQVTVFDAAYPEHAEKLSAATVVHLANGRCRLITLFVISRGVRR